MFKLIISYPNKKEESDIIQRFTEGTHIQISKVISAEQLLEIQAFNQKVYADQKIRDYVSEIVDATRHPEEYGLDIDKKIEFGASPRASLWLTLGAKAQAMLHGRGYVIPQDVKDVAYEVLRHRVLLTYEAEAEDITSEQIIKSILDRIQVP